MEVLVLINAENGILKVFIDATIIKKVKKVWIKAQGLPGIFTRRHTEPDWWNYGAEYKPMDVLYCL